MDATPPVDEIPTAEEQTNPIGLDAEQLEIARQELLAQQNLPMAVLAGVVSAAIGAAVWAGVTVATGYQIGYVAIGVGFLVGLAVRTFGKGITKTYSIVGAAFAFLGCAFGNLLSVCGFVAKEASLPFWEIVSKVLSDFSIVSELMIETFSPMDLLFYGFAIYEGYKLSLRQVTVEDLKSLAG